jgi:hypothetical protein
MFNVHYVGKTTSLRNCGGATGQHDQQRQWAAQICDLKGLSHEIFTVIFGFEWIYLGLNANRYWFLNFKEGS